jgi:large subunit ribosomal protein L10
LPEFSARQRLLFLKGGELQLAISKKQKDELVSEYTAWINRSKALILTEYTGLSMKQIDDLRLKAREAGGEFHVVKNTLSKVAFESAKMPLPEKFLEGSTAIAFAFNDAPGMAKTLTEFARTSDFLKIKGGYLDKQAISPDQVKALADLPPLPVMRAQLMGVLLAPATKLARTLAEPARQVAAALKAYAEKDVSTANV